MARRLETREHFSPVKRQNFAFEVNYYDSLADLTPWLTKAPTRDHAREMASAGMAWFGGTDHKATFNKAMYGSEEYVAKVNAMLEKVGASVDVETSAYRIENAIVGFTPDVPSAIIGIPECMITMEATQADFAPITVWAGLATSAGVGAEQVAKRGAVIAALILKLQAVRPVMLNLYVGVDSDFAVFPVTARPFSISQLSYVMCNPGFARHCYWTACGVDSPPGRWDCVTRAYGHSTRSPDAIKDTLTLLGGDLEHDILIPELHLSDRLLTHPVEWIEETLAKYRRG